MVGSPPVMTTMGQLLPRLRTCFTTLVTESTDLSEKSVSQNLQAKLQPARRTKTAGVPVYVPSP